MSAASKFPKGSIHFYPSQTPLSSDSKSPPYTGGPMLLLWSDIVLFLRCAPSIAGIFWPFSVRHSDIRDELYLGDPQNRFCIALHVLLVFSQIAFLGSWILLLTVPVLWFIAWVALYVLFNNFVCSFLNGATIHVTSKVPVEDEQSHEEEYWIFLNGVSVGRHWLQSNCDRLSETFGRRIHGVHNPTFGIIFDIIQCMIQRALCYSTQDVRNAYALVKKAVLDSQYKKVIFILHSQGGIEGGLILDWLLAEVPHDSLRRLEIYTFGNAANHFNNPHVRYEPGTTGEAGTQVGRQNEGAIRHIEHYANSGDFVARFGVLNYMSTANRFMGRIFQSPHSGHLLNQHYLHQMFPLTKDRKASEDNKFMQMKVSFSGEHQQGLLKESLLTSFLSTEDTGEDDQAFIGDVNSPISISSPNSLSMDDRLSGPYRVRDFSRLWRYRNGRSPEERHSERRD